MRSRAASCSSPPTSRPGSRARRSPSMAASSWIDLFPLPTGTRENMRHGSQPSGASSKTGEVEARRHGAACKRPRPEAARTLPRACRHEPLRVLAAKPIGPEPNFVARLSMLDLEQQRRAAMPVPQLGGVDAMPAGDFARLQQKQNGGGVGAALCAPARRGRSRGTSHPRGAGASLSWAITSSAVRGPGMS